DFARTRVEDIDAVDLDPDTITLCRYEGDVGLAENHEQVALTCVLEVFGHVKVSVHARLEHRNAAKLAELRGMSVVVESAGDENVEDGITGFASRRHQIGAGYGSELRAYKDRRPPFGACTPIAFQEASLGAHELPWPGRNRSKGNAVFFVRLLHTSGPER